MVRAQHRGICGKKVDTVEVGTFGAGNRLVNVKPGGKALTRPILRLDAVLVTQSKRAGHDHDYVRPGVRMPTGRLAWRKMEVLKHSVGAVRREFPARVRSGSGLPYFFRKYVARIRRTEVRPMFSWRAIWALLTPAR